MRLLTFSVDGDMAPRIGLAVAVTVGDYVVDARRVYAAYLRAAMNSALAHRLARALVPGDMRTVLEAGTDANRALRAAEAYTREQLTTLRDVSSWKRSGLLFAADDIIYHPPVPRPGKILAVGSNYPVDGAQRPIDTGTREVKLPVIFMKAASSLVGHGAAVELEAGVGDLDCEAELAVVIGRRAHHITPEDAADVIAGYTILNDLTLRDAVADERKRGAICFAKNFPGSAPCGPYVVTADEFSVAGDATIETWIGETRTQRGRISDMLIGVPQLVALCSRAGLEPGDIISTGSPKPPPGSQRHYLVPGDSITIRIAGLGELHSPVIPAT